MEGKNLLKEVKEAEATPPVVMVALAAAAAAAHAISQPVAVVVIAVAQDLAEMKVAAAGPVPTTLALIKTTLRGRMPATARW